MHFCPLVIGEVKKLTGLLAIKGVGQIINIYYLTNPLYGKQASLLGACIIHPGGIPSPRTRKLQQIAEHSKVPLTSSVGWMG